MLKGEVVIRLPRALNGRLDEYALSLRQPTHEILRRIIDAASIDYSDHDIEKWRLTTIESEQFSALRSQLPPQFHLTGDAATKLHRASRRLKLSMDDVAALIVSDTVDRIFSDKRTEPQVAKILPFRKPSK